MTPEQFRTIRSFHEMTRRQFADRTGLSAILVEKIERGERNVTDRTTGRINQALELTPEKLAEIFDLRRSLK